MREFVIGLDPKEIGNVAKELRKYKTELRHNIEKLIGMMCREGEDFAINAVGHINTGETLDSIHGYREGDIGYIVAGGAAVWLEFGTGITKAGWSGEGLPEGIVPHGQYGLGLGANKSGWYYPGKDGKYHHTMGIDATSFMWRTAQDLAKQAPAWAKEIFNGK